MFRDSEQPAAVMGECAFVFLNACAAREGEKFRGFKAGCSKKQLRVRTRVRREVNPGHETWGGVRQTNENRYGLAWTYPMFLSL